MYTGDPVNGGSTVHVSLHTPPIVISTVDVDVDPGLF